MPRLMPKIRSLLALCALVAIPLSVAACGDSVPGNAVARVGDTSITKAQFNHWLQVAAISLQGEAKDEGLKITEKEVQQRFGQLKKQSFQKEKDFQNFLGSSGMTLDDLLFRVRNNLLSDKLRSKIQKGTGKVTEAQIDAYYKKNKARFAQPQRRDLRLVL